jgi:AAA domain
MQSISNADTIGNSPVAFTWFERLNAPIGRRGETSWPALCDWINASSPTADTKDDLPLIKLATFRGDYRSDATMETVHGVEGDYDGEIFTPETAAALLRDAGIEALIYTTPSHQPDKPRWRVLAPLSRVVGAADRHSLLARVNGALGGILASESFTPAQPYYVGSTVDGAPVRCLRVEGQYIDTLDTITPLGPPQSAGKRIGQGERAPTYDIALQALKHCDPGDGDRNWWLLFSGSFFTATGGTDEALSDFQIWNLAYGETNNPADNAKTWRDFHRNGTNGDFGTLATLSREPVALAWHLFKGTPIPPMSKGSATTTDPANFFVRIADMVTRPPIFLIDGVIEVDSFSVLFGEPASGKSLVAIDMAASIATGYPFHDHTVLAGPVFYVAGEGKNGLRRRFAAWECRTGQSIDDAPLYASQAAVRFLDSTSANMVTSAIEQLAATCGTPRMIVVDTLARNFGDGDENSQKDMNAFIAALDQLRERFSGSTVLLVHHSGHGDKERARGSSALRGAVDAEYKVAKEGGAVHLTNHKMKDAAPPSPMAFALIEAAGSVALEYTGEPSDRSGKRTPSQTMVLAAFDNAAIDGMATLDAWRTAFYALHPGSDDAKRQAFKRGRKWTIEARILQSNDSLTYERVPMPGAMER